MTADRWRQVSEIFAAVRAHPPEARAAILDEQCQGSETLRADVEELLRHDLPSIPAIDVIARQLAGNRSRSAVGATLGTYTLQALIGEGGMGQVYRAIDTALGREVAVKIIPPVYAIDPDRRARFEREARLLASLNHPHIAAIHGLAEGEGLYGLVLELVEGETLAARLARTHRSGIRARGLTFRDALVIARQVAEGLEAAHDKGIVHRDLKPANISVANDGTVKVLDFGLAKMVAHDEGSQVSPVVTPLADPLATAIAGTAAYMSPEQAQGAALDKRSDIWAFGCVLYEMLTGARAFESAPTAENAQPDWQRLPEQMPPAVSGLLRRCLERDQKRRLRDIGEARVLLEDVVTGPRPEPTRVHTRRRLAFWSLAATAGLAAIALIIGGAFRPAPTAGASQPTRRVWLPLPSSQRPAALEGIAISANGGRLAYVADEAQRRLCVRDLAQEQTNCIDGTEGANAPFWSPNGDWVGYFADGRMRRVPAGGGASESITGPRDDSRSLLNGSATWAANQIIFSDGIELWTVGTSGDARPERITTLDRQRGEISHGKPTMLPDGRTLLYVV